MKAIVIGSFGVFMALTSFAVTNIACAGGEGEGEGEGDEGEGDEGEAETKICLDKCAADADCTIGGNDIGFVCRLGTCLPPACESDADCTQGTATHCQDTFCVDPDAGEGEGEGEECTSNDQCTDEICLDNGDCGCNADADCTGDAVFDGTTVGCLEF